MPARKLIDESLNQLLRARGSIREHMFEVSIQSANASYDMSNRAIALLKKDSVGPELVRREITRTDRLLERIDERAAQGGPQLDTNSLINDAHLLQNRARAHATEGRYILAFEETKQAREIARRIINRSGVGPETGRDAVASTLETTDLLIDRAFELARENQDDRAVRQLEEAARIQREAHDFFRNGQPDRALALTQRAREMAQKAARAMQKEISDDSVRQALERTDQILSRLREALDQSASDSATELYDRALARQNAARESFESGDLRKALANTKVARNLASTALQQIENGQI
jgi:tetratricopeptide (TPR) repeat protein